MLKTIKSELDLIFSEFKRHRKRSSWASLGNGSEVKSFFHKQPALLTCWTLDWVSRKTTFPLSMDLFQKVL